MLLGAYAYISTGRPNNEGRLIAIVLTSAKCSNAITAKQRRAKCSNAITGWAPIGEIRLITSDYGISTEAINNTITYIIIINILSAIKARVP